MGYTIFIRELVTPKIIDVTVEDEPEYFPAVYSYPEGQDPAQGGVGCFGVLVTPERYEPRSHVEKQLNPIPAPAYPPTFTRRVWYDRNMDYYGDSGDPRKRAELWEDSVGTASWAEIVDTFPLLPEYFRMGVRKHFQEQLQGLATPYMAAERETWHVQQREAEAWLADKSAAVPMIAAMAATRGIQLPDLVDKIMENVVLFRQAAGQILGQQQAMLDEVNTAQSIDELNLVVAGIGLDVMTI